MVNGTPFIWHTYIHGSVMGLLLKNHKTTYGFVEYLTVTSVFIATKNQDQMHEITMLVGWKKSCTTNLGWLKLMNSWDVYRRSQLVIRISQPP